MFSAESGYNSRRMMLNGLGLIGMIREVRIQSVPDLLPLLTEQEYRPDLDRNRSSYLYRGMPNLDFKMVTSLSRNCKHLQKTLEPAILQNFAKYAVRQDPYVSRNIWQCMITGQHNGLPTRLLDWSQSPLVGLHFAVRAIQPAAGSVPQRGAPDPEHDFQYQDARRHHGVPGAV